MLMENKKLKHLDIGYNEIGDDGVRNVTEGLQQNDTVTELKLYNCNISVKGNYCTLIDETNHFTSLHDSYYENIISSYIATFILHLSMVKSLVSANHIKLHVKTIMDILGS